MIVDGHSEDTYRGSVPEDFSKLNLEIHKITMILVANIEKCNTNFLLHISFDVDILAMYRIILMKMDEKKKSVLS